MRRCQICVTKKNKLVTLLCLYPESSCVQEWPLLSFGWSCSSLFEPVHRLMQTVWSGHQEPQRRRWYWNIFHDRLVFAVPTEGMWKYMFGVYEGYSVTRTGYTVIKLLSHGQHAELATLWGDKMEHELSKVWRKTRSKKVNVNNRYADPGHQHHLGTI